MEIVLTFQQSEEIYERNYDPVRGVQYLQQWRR
jgi:hypothetical protein